LLWSPPAWADGAEQIADGAGRFVFQDPATATGKRIPVWTFKPQNFGPDTPIVFVMHGASRNADGYRDRWIGPATAHGFLIIAPEFSKAAFPGSRSYNLGNVGKRVDGKRVRLPESQWTFFVIDRIFHRVRAMTGTRRTAFALYGHSAGGQFVHRYMMMTGGARVHVAVAANAGWYTLPDETIAFPYGLKGTGLPEARLQQAFAKPMTILLGEEDTKQGPSLRQTPEAMQQGPNRLARGRFFFDAARRAAQGMGAPFDWRIATVPGVGHSNRRMAPAAAQAIADALAGGGSGG
jgi:poly(3-hydroxybutyrate) depolymerase